VEKPTLLILDDYEGELAKAPATARLRQLATVTILDRPLETKDKLLLQNTQIILALRERTNLDAAFFDGCPQLRLVLQTGGHAYHIERSAASARNIVIVLGRHVTRPMVVVPELVFGLLLGLVKQIYPLNTEMHQGGWPQRIGGSLAGRTMGILGYGRHGKPVARLAEAFGMNVIAWNRTGQSPQTDEFGVRRLPLEELLTRADVVSIHLRLSEESRGLLNTERIAKIKPGAFLINTARGAIIDETALVEALQHQRIAGAGLDVFAIEPLPESSPLRTLPNVLLTPHVGWQVSDVLHEFVAIAADQLAQWLEGTVNDVEILNPEAMSTNST
jgi:phosphoglycerate dehydrogenase-like enzyme